MNTLFDKIWDVHVVQKVEDGPTQLYIDRLYCHEVTSPQAFAGLRARGIKCFRPEKIFCMPDHNTPTHDQDKPIEDPVSKTQVDTLAKNAEDFGLEHFGMMDQPSYAARTFSKLQLYTSFQIIPSIQLITTYETQEHPLNTETAEALVRQYFL